MARSQAQADAPTASRAARRRRRSRRRARHRRSACGRAAADGRALMAQRSTSAMRALYQFMNRLIDRLMVRYTAMMMRDALDRLAGLVQRGVGDRDDVLVADRDRERAVLGEVEVLAGHRRDDHPQRLRQHDLPQHLAAAAGPSAPAASHWPLRHRQDAGADDLGDVSRRCRCTRPSSRAKYSGLTWSGRPGS